MHHTINTNPDVFFRSGLQPFFMSIFAMSSFPLTAATNSGVYLHPQSQSAEHRTILANDDPAVQRNGKVVSVRRY